MNLTADPYTVHARRGRGYGEVLGPLGVGVVYASHDMVALRRVAEVANQARTSGYDEGVRDGRDAEKNAAEARMQDLVSDAHAAEMLAGQLEDELEKARERIAEARSLAQASLQLQPSAPYRRRVGRRRHVRVIYVGPQIQRGQWTGRVVVWHVDTKRRGVCHPNRLHPPLPAKAAEAKP